MSGLAIGWAKDQTAPCSTSKAVLIALADYANHRGEAWPAVGELARELQTSARTVQRALGKLVAAGLLTREAQFRPNGSQTTDRYTFQLAKKGAAPLTDCHPPGDTHVTPPVTPVSPLEPPLEPSEADASSTRASGDAENEGEAMIAAFRTAFGLWCEAAGGRAATFEPEAEGVWVGLCGVAVEPERLLGCVRAFLADPTLKRRSYGVGGMQGWLRKGGWKSYLGVVGEGEAAGGPVPGGRWVGPPEVRDFLVREMGEHNTRSYLDPAGWREDGRRVTPRTGVAFKAIRNLDWTSVGVTLVDPRGGR